MSVYVHFLATLRRQDRLEADRILLTCHTYLPALPAGDALPMTQLLAVGGGLPAPAVAAFPPRNGLPLSGARLR